MHWTIRLRAAGRRALIHFCISLLVAGCAAYVVFGLWYPHPYDELSDGRSLFLLMMAVDVVCGPVLTLVLFNPSKSLFKWRIDLTLIVLVQLGALVYGLEQVAAGRPVFLAFEGNRMRVVHASDIPAADLSQAPVELRSLSFAGPRLIGVKLATPEDADYLSSVQLSAQGFHPSFRPARWTRYSEQRAQVEGGLRSIAELREKNPRATKELAIAIDQAGVPESELGYLPLVRDPITDWVVVFRRVDAEPVAYAHLDGW
jgi:hypothetical protein